MNIEDISTKEEFFTELRDRFMKLIDEHSELPGTIEIKAKGLSPEEAIGKTDRKDFPILTGKDIMLQASCGTGKGQAFTDAPSSFSGTLGDICAMDLVNDPHARGLFTAALNAVSGYLGTAGCTVHCRNEGPELCAVDVSGYIKEHYGDPEISLFGYQPAMLQKLAGDFSVRAADLNPGNIGKTRFGVLIEDGGDDGVREDMCEKADLVLCTGSTVCNGTIVNFLPYREKTLFYGTTLAGAAPLMGLDRLCFAEKYL